MKRIFLFVAMLFIGCTSSNQQRTPAAAPQRIAKLQTDLKTTPSDARLWRDLGVAYFANRQYQAARQSLYQALKRDTRDPKTLFYLGLSLEFEKRATLALAVYESYHYTPRFSSYRKLMKARYYHLSRRLLRADMRALLQREQQFSADSIAANAVAVFPLVYQGKNEEIAALSKGLAEMLITDLSQVRRLDVIDRVRVQALLDEMALGQSGLVEATTAAKAGNLIRAGKIIRGSYHLLDPDKLNVDVAYWDVKKRANSTTTTHTDVLKNLFQLEKDIVFDVIEDMGIELTPAEREKIQRVPTQNLRAFIYYCLGLAKEDAGEFAQAGKYFLKAVELAPGFSWAADKAEIAAELSAVSGEPEEVLNVALALEQPAVRESDIVEDRLETLEENIDSNFEPGQDSRDATDTGFDIPLQRPPRPPE
jgi:TolB-like protein